MKFNDLLTGFIRLHILHHAAEREIYGQWMIDELAHHGYRLSPGTLYPMLHAMERNGYLTSRVQRGGRVNEVFTAFVKLGLTSFGGPIAHLGYFRDELVVRRKWLDETTYADLVALCQFLPGPASSQVGFSLGILRGNGLLGLS